jgi:hypothetical protein
MAQLVYHAPLPTAEMSVPAAIRRRGPVGQRATMMLQRTLKRALIIHGSQNY